MIIAGRPFLNGRLECDDPKLYDDVRFFIDPTAAQSFVTTKALRTSPLPRNPRRKIPYTRPSASGHARRIRDHIPTAQSRRVYRKQTTALHVRKRLSLSVPNDNDRRTGHSPNERLQDHGQRIIGQRSARIDGSSRRAEIVRKCQSDMLTVLSKADNSQEFMRLIPEALGVMRSYVFALRMHKIPVDQLHVAKRLSKKPDEYTNLVPQAVAAIHLAREGQETHAGQTVSYVVTNNKSRISANRALPAGFLEEGTSYDSEWYAEQILSSATNMLLPFRYDLKTLRRIVSR